MKTVEREVESVQGKGENVDEMPVMLARMSEQLTAIHRRLYSLEGDVRAVLNHGSDIAVLKNTVESQRLEIIQLRDRITKDYVKLERFEPLQKIVYGAAALVGASVLISLLSLLRLSH